MFWSCSFGLMPWMRALRPVCPARFTPAGPLADEIADRTALSLPARSVRAGGPPADPALSGVQGQKDASVLGEARQERGHRRQAGPLRDLQSHGKRARRLMRGRPTLSPQRGVINPGRQQWT